ncbi:MAG TPA: SDR family NAD(P)-dependent oxidoreductase [Bacteroidales bacterium]|nr:SDR family NAD(P)-dependent oxidoreductase [Bacteroidales bacterium]
MTEEKKSYALITGASAGLGKAIATELAGRGHNLVLVALPDTGLEGFCGKLSENHGIAAHCLEADMTLPETPFLIKNFTSSEGIAIAILINNVGVGYGGAIGTYSGPHISDTIFLNLRCTTLLTNLFIEDLKSHPEAYILNMGSFSGFGPLPFKSIYAASKAYIYNFSLSVGEELKDTGVKVSVAMPGPVKTNAKVLERINSTGPLASKTAMEVDEAAKEIISQMFRGKRVIVPGRAYKFFHAVAMVIPYGLVLLMTRNTFKGID